MEPVAAAGGVIATLQQPERAGRLVRLQVLRAVAASLVVMDHATEQLITRGAVSPAFQHLAWFLGWLGVAVFFIISGLIMIRTTARDFGQPGAPLRFLRRRVLRIVPLYWLATVVYAVLRVATGTSIAPSEFVRSLLFIPYRVGELPVMRPVVGQGWTLNFEMFFYLLFALCLFLPRRLGLAGLLLGLPALVLIGFAFHPPAPYLDPVTPLQFWSDPWMLLFVSGVLIGLAESHAWRWPRLRWRMPIPMTMSLALLVSAVLVFRWIDLRLPLQLPWQAVFGAICALCVMLCTARRQTPELRAMTLLVKAGDASFSMYLFHPLMLAGLAAVASRMPVLLASPMAFVMLAILLCNVGGYVVYALVEQPLARRFQGHVQRRATLATGFGLPG